MLRLSVYVRFRLQANPVIFVSRKHDVKLVVLTMSSEHP